MGYRLEDKEAENYSAEDILNKPHLVYENPHRELVEQLRASTEFWDALRATPEFKAYLIRKCPHEHKRSRFKGEVLTSIYEAMFKHSLNIDQLTSMVRRKHEVIMNRDLEIKNLLNEIKKLKDIKKQIKGKKEPAPTDSIEKMDQYVKKVVKKKKKQRSIFDGQYQMKG